jgi:hypothetical protein
MLTTRTGKEEAARRSGRWYRPVAVTLTLTLLVWAGIVFAFLWPGIDARGEIAYDPILFRDIAQRWVTTGEAYYPIQFAGAYLPDGLVNLYPPIVLYLWAPLLYVPMILWWIIPLGIVGWHIYHCRPAPWTWPVLALLFGLFPTVSGLIYGSSTMWSMAFIALGFRYPAAFALIVFKPIDCFVWLLAFRKRAFWIGLVVVGLAAIPFGDLWIEWVRATLNISATPLRNITGWAMLAVPVVAWLGRTDRSHGVVVEVGVRPGEPQERQVRGEVLDPRGAVGEIGRGARGDLL